MGAAHLCRGESRSPHSRHGPTSSRVASSAAVSIPRSASDGSARPLQDGDSINRRLRRLDPSYRVVRDRRTRAEHIAGSIVNERWHTSWLVLGLVTMGSAVATRQYGWALLVTVTNVVFNLYPVFHQRYKRARLRFPVDAPPA